ncbi:ESX secretion-associated protein EspG [Nocardia sp. NRRL S-836]|uniref:ESX secretion-associated protein EspG n=1 Tax=Nocardia sp. NRRL S-836 TaxID=1519492 RepID=UPI0006AF5F86|nr:ESX secretion-associated protein EspG [Nocardia sp. NRRL S-836]
MRMPQFPLSTYDFEVLWADVCPGPMPYPLMVPKTQGRSQCGAVLVEEVYRELVNRGMADRGRRADARLTRMLHLLGNYREAVDLVAFVGYPLQALAARDADEAVLAVLAGGELWLSAIRPDELAVAITDLLWEGRWSPARSGAADGPPATGRIGFSGRGRPTGFPALTWCGTDDEHYLVAETGSSEVELMVHDRVTRRVGELLASYDVGEPAPVTPRGVPSLSKARVLSGSVIRPDE